MAKKFSELEAKMSPQSQARATAKANFMLQEMALGELRIAQKLTQEKIAERISRKQGGVSRLENQTDMYVSTLGEYVRAVGGDLIIIASFPSGDVRINQFSGSIRNMEPTFERKLGQTNRKIIRRAFAGDALTQRPNRTTRKEVSQLATRRKSTNREVTSKRAASAAGRVLRKKKSSADAKTAAGSALTQRPNRSKKKK